MHTPQVHPRTSVCYFSFPSRTLGGRVASSVQDGQACSVSEMTHLWQVSDSLSERQRIFFCLHCKHALTEDLVLVASSIVRHSQLQGSKDGVSG